MQTAPSTPPSCETHQNFPISSNFNPRLKAQSQQVTDVSCLVTLSIQKMNMFYSREDPAANKCSTFSLPPVRGAYDNCPGSRAHVTTPRMFSFSRNAEFITWDWCVHRCLKAFVGASYCLSILSSWAESSSARFGN